MENKFNESIKLSNIIVSKLSELVKDIKEIGKSYELSDREVERLILTNFKILGDQSKKALDK